MKLAVLAIARPTFDLDAAHEFADAALAVVDDLADVRLGSSDLVLDTDALHRAQLAWTGAPVDALVVVQATFADSTLVATAARDTDAPLILWSAPEERTGGRLRRNSLCGVNLAAYALGQQDRPYAYLHLDPATPDAGERLRTAIAATRTERRSPAGTIPTTEPSDRAIETVERLKASRVGVIGRRPDGFEPCDVDLDATRSRFGVEVDPIPLDALFAVAETADSSTLVDITTTVRAGLDLTAIGDADIEPTLRLHSGLRTIAAAKGWSALATRCWPECFTDFGGAACTAQALMNDAGVPAVCEADAYGAITSLLLQWLGDGPALIADLVDADPATDTAVAWHCGVAPLAMAGEQPRAALHQNRGVPLLNEFVLRPGPVTVARLSQSRRRTRLVLGKAEVLDQPRPFSGTAGTLRFDHPVGDVVETIMQEGLEHHYGIVYGDVIDDLLGVAALLDLPVVEL